jgi:hypothetical protein
MAGPYLKSGESIVLTTDRVLIDDAEYDLILTTRRLALVDSAHTSDQAQVVPFASILSVKGGTTPAREPFIILLVVDPAGNDETRSLELVFSQQPSEDRSAECDQWVKKLIEYIVSVRQEPAAPEKKAAPEKPKGMQPSVRRFIAPDLPHPHTEVPQNRRSSEELLSAIQGVVWESPGEAAGKPAQEEPVLPEQKVSPAREEGSFSSVRPAKEKDTITEPVSGEQGPGIRYPDITGLTVNGEERDAPARERESTIPEEKTEHTFVPATPFRELVPESDGEEEDYSAPVLPDGRQAETAADIEVLSREIEQIVPAQDEEPAASRAETGIPDSVIFPVLSEARPDAAPPSSPPAISPEGTGPAGQTPLPQPKQKAAGTLVAIALVLLVIIGVTAIILLLPAGNSNGSINPAITPNATSPVVTTVSSVVVPSTGVWVKVTYNGTFVGSYGNPGPTNQQEVRGTGEQFYPIRNSNGTVQASFRKLDGSGNPMTVDVYNSGIIVTHVSKSSPGAEIDILVNPKTGAPYAPATTAVE